jgi:CheY-like chemotaxis protein
MTDRAIGVPQQHWIRLGPTRAWQRRRAFDRSRSTGRSNARFAACPRRGKARHPDCREPMKQRLHQPACILHKGTPMIANVFKPSSRFTEILRTFATNRTLLLQANTDVKALARAPRPLAGSQMNIALADRRLSAANRVLIVDGDADAADLLATLMRLSDPTITTMCAHTAHAALMFASEYKPDVAVFELGTQAMSGEAIAGGVLATCREARPLMIAMSGGGFEGEIRLKQIFDHVLTKPLEAANLVSLITQRPVLVQSGRG